MRIDFSDVPHLFYAPWCQGAGVVRSRNPSHLALKFRFPRENSRNLRLGNATGEEVRVFWLVTDIRLVGSVSLACVSGYSLSSVLMPPLTLREALRCQ